jgi:hypothetical protein
MEVTSGDHCMVAEDDDEIAARVCLLLDERGRRARLRDAARSLLEARYTAVPVMARMMDVYDEVARCA